MQDTTLDRLLAEFEDSDIVKMDIDLFGNRVSIDAVVDTAGNKNTHQVIFEQVVSVYYVNGKGKARYNLEPVDRIAWNACLYDSDAVGKVSLRSLTNLWAGQIESTPNFTLDLHGAGMFIEAGRIVIDGTAFDVGFPRDDS